MNRTLAIVTTTVLAAGGIAANTPTCDQRGPVVSFQFPFPSGCGGVTDDNMFDVTTTSDLGYPNMNGHVEFNDKGSYVADHEGLHFAGRYKDHYTQHGKDATYADDGSIATASDFSLDRTIELWDGDKRFFTLVFHVKHVKNYNAATYDLEPSKVRCFK